MFCPVLLWPIGVARRLAGIGWQNLSLHVIAIECRSFRRFRLSSRSFSLVVRIGIVLRLILEPCSDVTPYLMSLLQRTLAYRIFKDPSSSSQPKHLPQPESGKICSEDRKPYPVSSQPISETSVQTESQPSIGQHPKASPTLIQHPAYPPLINWTMDTMILLHRMRGGYLTSPCRPLKQLPNAPSQVWDEDSLLICRIGNRRAMGGCRMDCGRECFWARCG